MLSGKLIHLIEVHSKDITDRIVREILRHPDLVHLRQLPEVELRDRGQQILENLGYWLRSTNEEEIAAKQELLGRTRFEAAVPLAEAVLALCIVKDKMIDFVEEQQFPRDTLAMYAEEELEHRVNRFFDVLIVHLVRGYEAAWRRAAHAAA